MKKICLLAFSLLIFLFSFNISFATPYPADVEMGLAKAEKVNYELPYPGLLPDSPIYFLRVIRDRVISFLISDPLKKAEFNLLQADKRLNAGIYLFNKGKFDLAISTISKAENYFEEASQKTKEAKKQGMDVKNILKQLINSAKKHQEELNVLSKRSKDNFREDLLSELKRSEEFEKEVRMLIK